MRILNMFGFFCIFVSINFVHALSIINVDSNVLMQKCKNLDNLSPAVRLKKYLLCDYDSTVHPNYPKTTNVTLTLIPKHIDFEEHNATLVVHSSITLTWNDPHLTWTPSDYSEITYIQIYNWHIWTPDLIMTSFADILSDEHVLPLTRLVTNSGEIVFVSKVKFISKCNDDFTYWPYDKHECSITFISWMHIGEEVNLLIYKDGISMSRYMGDTTWDFKFINSTRVAKKYKCCPDDKFPMVTYNFLLTRHYGKHHSFIIIPAIALMLLTLTVFCLDLNSIERMTVASLNFICHLLCMYVLQWTMPYNGANSPNIMLFYRDSLTLATFAILLTALIRKLKSMNTEIPNWILFTTTFVLSNNVGRFLIFNDKSKITDTITEGSSDVPKSEMSMKEPSWKHFAAIIDWLFFFCMTITYVIILIVLVPVG